MKVSRPNSTLKANTDRPLRREKGLARTGGPKAGSPRRSGFTPVPGYDYSAFCLAVAERDGVDCFVRRNVPLPPELLACDGKLDCHHLLSKSWLKDEFPHGELVDVVIPGDEVVPAVRHVKLGEILSDPRNGIACCRKHHDLLENARITLTAAELPPHVWEFAAELGPRTTARLERDYIDREPVASERGEG